MPSDKYKDRYKKTVTWSTKKPPYEIGIDGFKNTDLKKDREGWVDPDFYLPHRFDLVKIQVNSGIQRGWWDGNKWDGLRLKDSETVLYWKTETGLYLKSERESNYEESND